ncbi:MAG: hypothetical protein ACC628_08455 [Pirellulaceae bacterium]
MIWSTSPGKLFALERGEPKKGVELARLVGGSRRTGLKAALLSILLSLFFVPGEKATAEHAPKEREVVKGITTRRIVQGEPYALAGKRLVFLNWYYIRPGGDADWVKPDSTSARVQGSAGPWEARFRSVDHAHGIRLLAQPAQRVGPLLEFERPWEGSGISFDTVIQDCGVYRAWGNCDSSKKGEERQRHLSCPTTTRCWASTSCTRAGGRLARAPTSYCRTFDIAGPVWVAGASAAAKRLISGNFLFRTRSSSRRPRCGLRTFSTPIAERPFQVPLTII